MPNQTAIIKPIVPADAPQLRELFKLSLSKNPHGFIQDVCFHGDIADRAEKYQAENGEMLGVFDGEKLIGFGGLKYKDDTRVELCNLHLHPDYHGQGLGKRLSYALIDDARALDYDIIELHVTVTQDSAIGLYKHLGFVETKRQVYDVGGNSYDTVFMEMKL
jgi:ribosomal protein S18 acetylase RimI-like enzyme